MISVRLRGTSQTATIFQWVPESSVNGSAYAVDESGSACVVDKFSDHLCAYVVDKSSCLDGTCAVDRSSCLAPAWSVTRSGGPASAWSLTWSIGPSRPRRCAATTNTGVSAPSNGETSPWTAKRSRTARASAPTSPVTARTSRGAAVVAAQSLLAEHDAFAPRGLDYDLVPAPQPHPKRWRTARPGEPARSDPVHVSEAVLLIDVLPPSLVPFGQQPVLHPYLLHLLHCVHERDPAFNPGRLSESRRSWSSTARRRSPHLRRVSHPAACFSSTFDARVRGRALLEGSAAPGSRQCGRAPSVFRPPRRAGSPLPPATPLVPESAEPIPFTLRVPRRVPTSSLVSPVLVSESRSRMASPAQHLVKSRSCVSFTSFLLPSRSAFQIELLSWPRACCAVPRNDAISKWNKVMSPAEENPFRP